MVSPVPPWWGQDLAAAISLLPVAGRGDPKGCSPWAAPSGTRSPSHPCPHRGRRRLSCPGHPVGMRGVRAMPKGCGSWLGVGRGQPTFGPRMPRGPMSPLSPRAPGIPSRPGWPYRIEHMRGLLPALPWAGTVGCSGTQMQLLTGSPGSPGAPTSPWGWKRHWSGQVRGWCPSTPPSNGGGGSSSSPSARQGHVPLESRWSPSRLAPPSFPASRDQINTGQEGELRPWHSPMEPQGPQRPAPAAPLAGAHQVRVPTSTSTWTQGCHHTLVHGPSTALHGPNPAAPSPTQAPPAPYLLSRHALLPFVPLVPFCALQATVSLQSGKHRGRAGHGKMLR